MAEHEAFESDVLSGELIGAVVEEHAKDGDAEIWIGGGEGGDEGGPEPVQISGSPNGPGAETQALGRRIARVLAARRRRGSRGEVPIRIRTNEDVARYYRIGRARYDELGLPGSFLLALCVWFWETWIHELRVELSKWHDIHRRDRFRCASPGCNRRLCTLHHILWRMLGGDDRWTNLLTLCEVCHLKNIHERGSLQVFGKAPDGLTFVFGVEPLFVVRGREKREAA